MTAEAPENKEAASDPTSEAPGDAQGDDGASDAAAPAATPAPGEDSGRVEGLNGSHGVALVPEAGRGYVTNNGHLTAFDLETLKVVGDIPTGDGADAVVYDSASRRLFVMNGKAQTTTVIDPAQGTVDATIPLGGKPEFSASDGRGSVYVNIESTHDIVRIDTRILRIDARWPIPACEAPHGLAVDATTRRLFSGCVNAKLLVIDADDGRIVATLPIGNGIDAVVFDAGRGLVFSSNGDGTLSIIADAMVDAAVEAGRQRQARELSAIAELAAVPVDTLATLDISPAGTGLDLDNRDVYISGHGLVLSPSSLAAGLGERGGAQPTPARRDSAHHNGQLGGRPKKTSAGYVAKGCGKTHRNFRFCSGSKSEEGFFDDPGVPVEQRQQNPRRSLRNSAALLPVPQCRRRDADAAGERRLG